MRDRIHVSFIRRPIAVYLQEAVDACSNLGVGIENYSIIGFVMQACFLNMTGASEQKMKCICWEVATDDYEYRYEWLKTSIGEYSAYADKNGVYKMLMNQIRKDNPAYVFSDKECEEVIKEVAQEFEDIIADTPLALWSDRLYNEAKAALKQLTTDNLATEDNLLVDTKDVKVQTIYTDYLYRQRNRLAHNATSYQENLPSLKSLAVSNGRYENYYLWFVLLMVIDGVFRRLFEEYCNQ